MAVLGRSAEGGDGWCEYEIDEGCVAAVHNVSITEETFPLGLTVDFTSQKTFTAKGMCVEGQDSSDIACFVFTEEMF